jgi:hypothetical protein
MKSQRLLVILAFVTIMPLTAAITQSDGDYQLSWYTVAGGGIARSKGGNYELVGTIGQADAGLMRDTGYELTNGFWAGVPAFYPTYLPIVHKP